MKEFKNKKILKIMLYAEDIVKEVSKYIEEMDIYYNNLDNTTKDEKSYNIYCKFKNECMKKAKERGIVE